MRLIMHKKNTLTAYVIIALSSLFIAPDTTAASLTHNLQTTLTTGTNNGNNETYAGLWFNSKKNIGLTRNSLISLKGSLGGKTYQDKTSANVTDFLLSANYLYQPSAGFFSPLYSAKIQYKQESFEGTSTNTDKTSLSLFRSQPLNSKIKLAFGYKIEQETGTSDIDTQSLVFNLDYTHNFQSLYYFNLNVSDEDQNITLNTNNPGSPKPAQRTDIAGGHLPGENGHTVTNSNSNNNIFNSSNSSISIGTVYTINERHSFDIALIKHFYKVTNEATNATSNSSSSYFAIDYFYHF